MPTERTSSSADPIVSTTHGRIAGSIEDGVLVFRGIPYAAPPLGPRRWQPPEPPARWDDVRSAKAFGNAAPQHTLPREVATTFAQNEVTIIHEQLDEDCLYLNVWTPGADGAKRPVLVWIHGGAFEICAGSQALYDGRIMARRCDVVVVTFNYRLGPFGFLRLVDETDGAVPATGSEGLLDQVAALEWIAENIARFGGDRDNVTVFGESSGGISIAGLLAMPRTRGLFSRAIVQSGPPAALPVDVANSIGRAALERLGSKISPRDLLEADATKVLEMIPGLLRGNADISEIIRRQKAWLTVDGSVLTEQPAVAIARGSAAGVNLLAGVTRDEYRSNFVPGVSLEKVQNLLGVYVPHVDAADWPGVVEKYTQARMARMADTSPHIVGSAIHGDVNVRIPTIRLLEAHRPHGSVHHYVFTWTQPAGDGSGGAPHAGELGLLFGTHEISPSAREQFGAGPAATALSEAMQDAWTAFARTGDPSCASLGTWAPYGESRSTMLIGELSGVQEDPWSTERRVWDDYDTETILPAYVLDDSG